MAKHRQLHVFGVTAGVFFVFERANIILIFVLIGNFLLFLIA